MLLRKVISTALFFSMFTLSCFAEQYPVLKVVNGDTIDINYNGTKERVRLPCVDIPESVHPDQSKNTVIGRKASEYTKKRLSGKSVNLEFENRIRGKYGRLLAYVILDGANYNLELVREGWSSYHTEYRKSEHHHTAFLAAENEVRDKQLNIWAGEVIQFGNQDLSCKLVRGNVKSLKFHGPGCRYFDCKNCTKAFPSRHEAIKAGYSPCGICNP